MISPVYLRKEYTLHTGSTTDVTFVFSEEPPVQLCISGNLNMPVYTETADIPASAQKLSLLPYKHIKYQSC